MGFGDILKGIAKVGSPFIPVIGSAIGGLLGNTKAARTTTGTTSGTSSGTSSSTMMPTIAPEYKTLADLLRTRAMDRLNASTDLSGYGASGVANINDAFKGIDLASNNNLTSRGLATSPVAGVVDSNLGMARGGEIAQFLNTLPLLQRQFQNEDMANAGNVLQFGRGTSTTGTTSGTTTGNSTMVGPGSALGGAFSSAAKLLAYLHGNGNFDDMASPARLPTIGLG